jgi:hypothetical protein
MPEVAREHEDRLASRGRAPRRAADGPATPSAPETVTDSVGTTSPPPAPPPPRPPRPCPAHRPRARARMASVSRRCCMPGHEMRSTPR